MNIRELENMQTNRALCVCSGAHNLHPVRLTCPLLGLPAKPTTCTNAQLPHTPPPNTPIPHPHAPSPAPKLAASPAGTGWGGRVGRWPGWVVPAGIPN